MQALSRPMYNLHSAESPVILAFGSSVSAEFLLLANEDYELCYSCRAEVSLG
jgi:hypothetical protein